MLSKMSRSTTLKKIQLTKINDDKIDDLGDPSHGHEVNGSKDTLRDGKNKSQNGKGIWET